MACGLRHLLALCHEIAEPVKLLRRAVQAGNVAPTVAPSFLGRRVCPPALLTLSMSSRPVRGAWIETHARAGKWWIDRVTPRRSCNCARNSSILQHSAVRQPRATVVETSSCRCLRAPASASVPTQSFKFPGQSADLSRDRTEATGPQFPKKSAR